MLLNELYIFGNLITKREEWMRDNGMSDNSISRLCITHLTLSKNAIYSKITS